MMKMELRKATDKAPTTDRQIIFQVEESDSERASRAAETLESKGFAVPSIKVYVQACARAVVDHDAPQFLSLPQETTVKKSVSLPDDMYGQLSDYVESRLGRRKMAAVVSEMYGAYLADLEQLAAEAEHNG